MFIISSILAVAEGVSYAIVSGLLKMRRTLALLMSWLMKIYY